jgi:hypothetical protein
MNLAKTVGAMVVATGEITGVRASKVESRTIFMVNHRQIYYVEKQMAKAFGYSVGDKCKVYEYQGKYYLSATKNKDGKKDV